VLIPYGTDRPLRRPTLVTYALVGVNIAVALAGAIYRRLHPDAHDALLQSLWLFEPTLRPWSFVTYQFLHAGIMHLLGNMLFLWVFGPNVEDRLGRAGFLAFYVVGGAAAGAVHLFFASAAPDQAAPPVIGASGAIAAVTGAYLVLFPKTLVRVFIIFFVIGSFEIPAFWLIFAAILKDTVFHGLGADRGIALLAHLGGYAFGSGISFLLLATHLLTREPYDLFSIGRQAARRRAFRELTTAGQTPWKHELDRSARVRKEQAESDLEAVARRRAMIVQRLGSGSPDAAAALFEELLDDSGEQHLGRAAQLEMANYCFTAGRHQTASIAYAVFLKKCPDDREVEHVRLMLALINARYLNDPLRAKSHLREINAARLSEEQRRLLDELALELG